MKGIIRLFLKKNYEFSRYGMKFAQKDIQDIFGTITFTEMFHNIDPGHYGFDFRKNL